MGKQKNKRDQITELVILLILLIISFFLWDTYFIYPIKLFVVLLHELGHSIAALLIGGKIITMNIGFDLSGRCETEGGNTIFIASAGYLGSLLWGILFFISPNNKKSGFWIIIVISIMIVLTTIGVATGATFILLALILSALLITAAFYLRIPIVSIIVRAFGLISCVYVLFDIKDDLLFQRTAISDATLISSLTNISTTMIGITWVLISIICIYIAIRFSYKN
jgi:hypothetical protein